MRHRSITNRLTLLFASGAIAILVTVGTLCTTMMASYFDEQEQAALQTKLALVRTVIANTPPTADLPGLRQYLADALAGYHDVFVNVRRVDGTEVFTSPGAMLPTSIAPSGSLSVESLSARSISWQSEGRSYRGVHEAMYTGGATTVPTTIGVAIDTTRDHEFLAEHQRSMWLAVVIGLLPMALLGLFAARRGMSLVHDFASVARGVSASHLSDRLPIEDAPAELVELGGSFNMMLGRLEDSFRRLFAFSSDIAHELRTPVSNLMTQTQVALSKPRSAEAYREILHSNLEEYERLSRIVTDMLFLAKADNGLIVPRHEVIDVALEVDQLMEFYDALATQRGLRLMRTGAETIAGDKLMIRRAISNLLSNAIRYTPNGGVINVEIDRADADAVRITVDNPGDEIPPESLPRLFDRFFRVDPARQRDSEGAGLGLAITRSIVEAHGGKISAHSGRGRTRFEITVPASQKRLLSRVIA